ncbi:MAG: hypothetical protein IJB15_07905 [Clostridia bacterium]|nr:hypothetical protein [Clostridia bacterium]
MKKLPILLLALLLPLTVLLSSCGGSMSEAEVSAVLGELIPASYPLNEIYFGEGLPISDDRADVEAFYAAAGMDNDISLNYHPVSPECEYTSVEAIKAATLEVFSESYSKYLFTMAFDGLSSVFNADTEEQLTQTVSYARYMETDGILTVRMNIGEEAMPLNRTYDTNDIEIIRDKLSGAHGYLLVEVQSYVDGQPDVKVEVKLVKNADGQFRLDSPTY